MQFKDIEGVTVVLDGVLKIKKELNDELDSLSGYDAARKLAIKYWSLIGTTDECAVSIDNFIREMHKNIRMVYAKVANTTEGSEAAKKREAENSTDYILLKDELARGELLKAYIRSIREEVFAGHYMMKTMYERDVDIYLSSPKTEN